MAIENKQKVFDTVSKHLMQQKVPAQENGASRYRANNGLKCALGILIPEEAYRRKMEGWDMSYYEPLARVMQNTYCRGRMEIKDKNFFHELQFIHDHVRPISWKNELEGVAKRHDLVLNI